jgi:GPN-loop GTPase
VLHLIDSYALTQPSLYISTLLLSLRSMLQLDLPTLNVLTKIDKLSSYAPLPFPLSFYTQVQDLSYLMPHLEAENPAFSSKYSSLNQAIIGLVEDFGLVGFETLAVEDRRSMMTLLQAVDRAGGYAFGSAEGAGDGVWATAMREGYRGLSVEEVQERWVDRREEMDEREREREEERWAGGGGDAKVGEREEKGKGEDMEVEGDEDDDMQRELEKFRSKGGDSGVKVVRKD